MNELQLVRYLKEMEDFTKELKIKIKSAQARRDTLNLKGSWISHDFPIDFLIGYYFWITHTSEQMIEKFLNDIEIKKKRNRLHSVLEKPTKPIIKETICPECDNDFEEPGRLKKHIKKCKGKNIKQYLCPNCNKWKPEYNKRLHILYEKRRDKNKIKNHVGIYSPKSIIPTKDSPIGCAKCDIIMTSEAQYNKHAKEGCKI